MRLLNTILDTLFPINCVSCGMSGENICLKCLSLCREAERESASWIFPLFDYRHPPIKKVIWLIKYSGKKRLIAPFAEILYGRIIEELSDRQILENFQNPILVPIPLSRKRYRERGFNQAELLCQEILKIDKNKYLRLEKKILIKTKNTEHQARIRDRSKRLRNLSDSFEIVNKENLRGKNVILIDDVTTTGATFGEAKKILKASGARKVIAFALAH